MMDITRDYKENSYELTSDELTTLATKETERNSKIQKIKDEILELEQDGFQREDALLRSMSTDEIFELLADMFGEISIKGERCRRKEVWKISIDAYTTGEDAPTFKEALINSILYRSKNRRSSLKFKF